LTKTSTEIKNLPPADRTHKPLMKNKLAKGKNSQTVILHRKS